MLEANLRARKEVWRQDLRQIKSLGFHTILAWIDWTSGEPAEGRYSFFTLDIRLDLAEEEDLKVFAQVYMDSAPPWVGAVPRRILVVDDEEPARRLISLIMLKEKHRGRRCRGR